MSHNPHISIPFSSTGQAPMAIPTPPSSSGSNQGFSHLTSPASKFVHPARRRGSADSYLSEDDHHYHPPGSGLGSYPNRHPARSPSYSYSLTSSNRQKNQYSPQLSPSPGACLVIRSSSTNSPRSGSPKLQSPRRASGPSSIPNGGRQGSRDSISSIPSGELEFDVEPLSPFSYAPRLPSLPPSRKNSRDMYSHMNPPISNLTQNLEKYQLQQQQQQQPQPQQQQQYPPPQQLNSPKQRYQPPPPPPPVEEEEEETTIQLHMMPKNMLLPLPDRNGEMKHLLDHNAKLAAQIKRRLGEAKYAAAVDLWTHTRRSEVSDHEWLRRSRYFLQSDEKLWNEWAMMVGWDFSRDLTKDEKGEVRGVEEYAQKMGHMACLEEEEE
ncbi:hypothetical protein H072_1124 [Dactylellina haptotyla CBS 200.50]|uniref:Uncharacterized protein n=1 Tax=Dactylellina haptotyla (strain CBS 200.50) TaxID=1284197 RepID=S8APL3_DACHA|nr:hypothetical protein H072_1124 [Dactylellina haptotyla CBS 200.50]